MAKREIEKSKTGSIIDQMAVVKTYDIISKEVSHLWDGEQPEMTVREAISLIKSRKRTGRMELDYIGDRHVLDVDPSKIKCDVCRENLGAGVERR